MQKPRARVAAIVPAYNEAPTIGIVVRALVKSGFLDDVIVVSDGSTDQTASVAKANGATCVLALPRNIGKGQAMRAGVMATSAEVIFFCDADLKVLSKQHVRMIIEPVIKGRLMMCVGLYDRGPLLTKIEAVLPLISGQRAMRREIFLGVPGAYMQGFMVESALNYYCRCHGFAYDTVKLDGLRIRHKIDKVGFWRGAWEYLHMSAQIIRALLVVRVAHARKQF